MTEDGFQLDSQNYKSSGKFLKPLSGGLSSSSELDGLRKKKKKERKIKYDLHFGTFLF